MPIIDRPTLVRVHVMGAIWIELFLFWEQISIAYKIFYSKDDIERKHNISE